MKIAFHINSLGLGGAERVVAGLAERFSSMGDDIVLATEWQADEEYRVSDKVRRVDVGLTADDDKKGRLGRYLARIRHLKDFIRDEKPDVLIAFMHGSIYRSLMAATGSSVPVIISVRNDPATDFASLPDRILTAIYMKRAAGGVFQTREAAAFFRKELGNKSEVILNPLNDKYMDTTYPESRTRRIVNVARLAHQKNQDMLIRAFAIVHKSYPDYRLEIYGPDGDAGVRDMLLKRVEELGLTECVELMGSCQSLDSTISDAAAFALSSDYEGLPNSLMEAMAMGIPCVSTDCPCGGPAELIHDGENGFLVPVGDAERMADRLIRIISDDKLSMMLGRNAMKIRQAADMDIIADKWKTFIDKVLAK
ncbi:glycosyltransferase [Butyrivibrio sp. MC2013]|uniref:glycosyltransferase n=1 Tax=Butyrivibrio sp. MC2013 TaxID=1280686 RepID=UPI0004260775|nr:glycosyltransferase [Butyrivibrio sp. MC2013]